jgi:hypothetical protein
MDVDQPNALTQSLGLPQADLDLVLRGNAKRLFRL